MNNAPEQYVVKRCSDTKYNGGWHTDLTADGLNALRWKELPFRSGESIIRFRYASEGEITVCCQIGNEMTQKSHSRLPAMHGKKPKWQSIPGTHVDMQTLIWQ